MWRKEFKTGSTAIKQGDKGDNFYVIEAGSFNVFVQKEKGGTRKVSSRGKAECFGELALMYDAPRAATVTASTDAVCWVVDRFTFRRVLTNLSDSRLNECVQRFPACLPACQPAVAHRFEEFLKRVPLLAPLSAFERSKVAEALSVVNFKAGDSLFAQGDKGDKMFILRKVMSPLPAHNSRSGRRVIDH